MDCANFPPKGAAGRNDYEPEDYKYNWPEHCVLNGKLCPYREDVEQREKCDRYKEVA